MSPRIASARLPLREAHGNPEKMRITHAIPRMSERVAGDIRYSIRALRRTPIFTSVALLCLALGLAANTTMFSVFDAIAIRQLPFPEAERLVSIALREAPSGHRASLRYAEYLAMARAARSFSGLAAYAGRMVAITESARPERVSMRLVTPSLFPLLGARAQLGRLLDPGDDQVGGARVAVIGDALWRRRYGADAAVIGHVLSLDGVPHTIVGVMERGFAYPSTSELWVPVASGGTLATSPVSVVGRLASDVDIRQAAQEIRLLGARVSGEQRISVGVAPSEPIAANWLGDVRPLRGTALGSDEALVAAAMLGATTFLLLIACTNVANLLLARAVVREREIAVRIALGAGRGRIVAQLLTEGVVLSLTACAIALPAVRLALRAIRDAIPPSDAFPYYVQWSLDVPTFTYAAIASVATAALFSVGPALHATRGAVHESLKEGAQGSGNGRRRNVLQNTLIVVEVALALVLLVGASLFVRTFRAIDRTNLGYDPSGIMTMRFYLPGSRYDSASARLQAVRDVLRHVAAVPGVDAATVSDLIPLDDEGGSSGEAVPDRADARRFPSVAYAAVAGDWFATFGVALTAGRSFSAAESQSGAPVAVINEAMAKAFWRGASPIGRRFRFVKDSTRTWYEVIGVAPDIRTVKLDEDMGTPPTAYLPPRFVATRDYGLMVRTRRPPASLTHDLVGAIHAADPIVPVHNAWTMDEVRYLSFWMYVLWGTMFAVFGAVALVLATIGVYGVIHSGVAQRTREIGVRVALGAQRRDVLRLVLGRALVLVAIGVAAGLVGALGLTRIVESLLIGVSPTDPTSFLAMALVLGIVALVASYLPARRAMRVDPTVALRQE